MLPHDRTAPRTPTRRRRRRRRDYDDAHDTPPFGVGRTPGARRRPRRRRAADSPATSRRRRRRRSPFEIRDRLIELDDLRRRGILSEEEFAAKKSELLNRI